MESFHLDSLFLGAPTAAKVVGKSPQAQVDLFKIPMKIIERVMSNRYSGDGTVHPGEHLLFIHELCELFKCAGITMDKVKKKLFSFSLSEELRNGISCCVMANL